MMCTVSAVFQLLLSSSITTVVITLTSMTPAGYYR